jgi:hypothetical protein
MVKIRQLTHDRPPIGCGDLKGFPVRGSQFVAN